MRQRSRMLQASPAIHEHERGHDSEPGGMDPYRQTDKSGDTNEAEDRSYHQAARTSQHKPEQGAKNLAAIKRIDGQYVENQQNQVDPPDRLQQHVSIGHP